MPFWVGRHANLTNLTTWLFMVIFCDTECTEICAPDAFWNISILNLATNFCFLFAFWFSESRGGVRKTGIVDSAGTGFFPTPCLNLKTYLLEDKSTVIFHLNDKSTVITHLCTAGSPPFLPTHFFHLFPTKPPTCPTQSMHHAPHKHV